jgi:hypothetical protein
MQNETQTQEATIPAIIPKASDPEGELVDVQCADCGTALDTRLPAFLAKWKTLCDDCALKQATSDQERIKAEAVAERLSGWFALCPADFREIDLKKLPRPEFYTKVMRWPMGPRGLVLHGKTGLGKSRCAWQLLKREYDRGTRIAVVDHAGAYDYMARFDRSDGRTEAALWVERLGKVGLLFLDDVFKAKFTDSFEQALFTIIATRCEHCLPIILTTNDVGASLTARMSADRGAAMVRRLRDHADSLAFV